MKKNCITCKYGDIYANPYCEACLYTGCVSKWEPKEMEEREMNIHVEETKETKLNYHERLIEDLKAAGQNIIDNEETKETKLNYHERLIEDLKAAGQSIIDNAESIIGSEKWLHDVRVMITINPSEATIINVDRDFYPEGIIK